MGSLSGKLGPLTTNAPVEQHRGVSGDRMMDPGQFHEWVWSAAKELFRDGHYEDAVARASKAVESNLQNKIGKPDLQGAALAHQVLKPDTPSQQEARLWLMPHPKGEFRSKTWTSRQDGLRYFAVGCFQAIRNPSHYGGTGMPKMSLDEALERLAALSLLARWIGETKPKYGGRGRPRGS